MPILVQYCIEIGSEPMFSLQWWKGIGGSSTQQLAHFSLPTTHQLFSWFQMQQRSTVTVLVRFCFGLCEGDSSCRKWENGGGFSLLLANEGRKTRLFAPVCTMHATFRDAVSWRDAHAVPCTMAYCMAVSGTLNGSLLYAAWHTPAHCIAICL